MEARVKIVIKRTFRSFTWICRMPGVGKTFGPDSENTWRTAKGARNSAHMLARRLNLGCHCDVIDKTGD